MPLNIEVKASNLIPPDYRPDRESKVNNWNVGICKVNYFQIPTPTFLQHGHFLSDDKDCEEDRIQALSFHFDPEEYDTVAEEDEVIVQARSKTAIHLYIFNTEETKIIKVVKSGNALLTSSQTSTIALTAQKKSVEQTTFYLASNILIANIVNEVVKIPPCLQRSLY